MATCDIDKIVQEYMKENKGISEAEARTAIASVMQNNIDKDMLTNRRNAEARRSGSAKTGGTPSGLVAKNVLDHKNKTLLIRASQPDASSNIDNELSNGFSPKKEYHITALGFPQGKQLKKIFEKNPEKEAQVQELINKSDFSYIESNEVHKISRDMEVWVDWKDHSKGKKTNHDEAIIVKVDAPGVATFINELNTMLGTDFPIPFPHISIATLGSPMGIGIANESAFKKLNPKAIIQTKGRTQGSNGIVKNPKFDMKEQTDSKVVYEKEYIKETFAHAVNELFDSRGIFIQSTNRVIPKRKRGVTEEEYELSVKFTSDEFNDIIQLFIENTNDKHVTLLRNKTIVNENGDVDWAYKVDNSVIDEKFATQSMTTREDEAINLYARFRDVAKAGKTQGSNFDNDFLNTDLEDQVVFDEEIDLGKEDNFFERMQDYIFEDERMAVAGEHIQKRYSKAFYDFQLSGMKMMQDQFNKIDMSTINLTEIQTSMDEIFDKANESRETAGQITHDLMGGPADVKLRWNRFSANSRKSEVFMHEMVHFLTQKAFNKDPRMKQILDQLRKKALKSGIDYRIFLQDLYNSGQEPSSIDVEIAKRQFQYVFDEYADPEEFFAYAMTNEHVFNAVKNIKLEPVYFSQFDTEYQKTGKKKDRTFKDFMNTFIKVINKVWGKLAGTSGDGDAIIMSTMKQLMESQSKIEAIEARDNFYKNERINKFAEKMTDYDKRLSTVVEDIETRIDKLNSASKKKTSHSKFKKIYEKIPLLQQVAKTQIFQNIYTEITEKTDNPQWAHLYEMFRQGKDYTEKHSKAISDALKRHLGHMFEGVDEPTRKAITRVIFKLDLPSLDFKKEGVRKLLDDDEFLDDVYSKSIISLKEKYAEIGDSDSDFKSDLEQMIALSKHMTDGKIHIKNQQFNADNIYNKYYLSGVNDSAIVEENNDVDLEMISEINRFITISSIRYAGKEDKKLVSDYLSVKENRDNITEMMNEYKFYVTEAADDMKVNNFNSIKKGYFASPSETSMKFDIVPEHDLEHFTGFFGNMKNIGLYGEINGVKYFKVTGRSHELGYDEGMLSIVGNTVPGKSLKGLLVQNIKATDRKDNISRKRKSSSKIDETVVEMIQEIVAGGGDASFLNIADNQHLIPVYDATGDIVDYHIDLDVADTVENLGQDLDVVTTAATTFSKLKHRQAAIINNKRVIDTLIKYSKQYAAENPDDFVVLHKHESGVFDEEIHGRWNRIPDYTRNYIYDKTGENAIVVPKNKVHFITGEKEVSFSNFKLGPVDVKNSVKSQKTILAIEGYIREVLGYLKETIAIRTGAVVAANTISNMFQAWIRYGIDPIEYIKKATEKWAELDAYRELDTQLNDLFVQRAGANTSGQIKKIDRDIASVQNQMSNNSFDKLVKDGQFSPIIEDVNTGERPTGHLAQKIEEVFTHKNMPKGVNTVKEVIMLDRNTALYKAMLKITQYGDTVTREIIRESQEEKAIKAGNPLNKNQLQSLLNELDQLFVNYGYTANRFVKYAERLWEVFFTKYLFRQAKAMHSVATKAPASFSLLVGAEQLTGIDIKTADDDYWDFFGALGGRLDIDNPYEIGMKVLSPKIGSVGFDFGDLYS